MFQRFKTWLRSFVNDEANKQWEAGRSAELLRRAERQRSKAVELFNKSKPGRGARKLRQAASNHRRALEHARRAK